MVELEVSNLYVKVEGREIIRGVSFHVGGGKITVIVGPNGSGKSSLLLSIMGHPRYTVTQGKILLNGEDISSLKPHERARKGIFLAFQNPPELPGVNILSFLTEAASKLGRPSDIGAVYASLQAVGLPKEYSDRNVNEGFSGGEKKRLELAQAFMLDPSVVMLDEPDSGLDIEGLRMLSRLVRDLASRGKTVLLVSHNPKTLEYISPDKVLVLVSGRIALEGGIEVVRKIESEGFPVIAE
ncbi:Fe-S cluster assembly ATPase SufC [Infirmifilum uzonense]|uniref:Fe-S cluster assembly ATPase SufC n=1 Tax=Infirmifilum uzonense TaxID=1550241 RepID=UPI003C766760